MGLRPAAVIPMKYCDGLNWDGFYWRYQGTVVVWPVSLLPGVLAQGLWFWDVYL